MNPLSESVIALARGALGPFEGSALQVVPLQKGGSDRHFYRIIAGSNSLIVVSYTGHREENRHYVAIGEFLDSAGVAVPKVYFHDPEQGLIFLQDLGDTDLWAFREGPPESRRLYYESALEEAVRLHGPASQLTGREALRLEMEFDEQLYLWEQNYFFEHCLGAVFGMPRGDLERLAALDGLRAAAADLASLQRTLVHRDFQSQNIMISRQRTWLIDFQGMRPGLPHYDVASLLYDPYAVLPDAERDHLAAFYFAKAEAAGIPTGGGDFRRILDLCAMQRLMQALGAYGFLGLNRGRPHFLEHISPARKFLREVLARVDGTSALQVALDLLK